MYNFTEITTNARFDDNYKLTLIGGYTENGTSAIVRRTVGSGKIRVKGQCNTRLCLIAGFYTGTGVSEYFSTILENNNIDNTTVDFDLIVDVPEAAKTIAFTLSDGLTVEIYQVSEKVLTMSDGDSSILWLGTSIPEGCLYPNNACSFLGYTCYNKSLGSSGITVGVGVLENDRDGRDLSESAAEKSYSLF